MQFMGRYQRLIAENSRFDFFHYLGRLKSFEDGEAVPQPTSIPVEPGRAYYGDYISQNRWYSVAVLAAHLGIDERREPLQDVKKVVELTSEAYFGEWWTRFYDGQKAKFPTPPHEIRGRFFVDWVTDYCYGVQCALMLDDDYTAGRLGCYPGPDVPTDEADRGLRRVDTFFHVILGSYLRYGDLDHSLSEWRAAVRDGTSVRAKLWMKALVALDKEKPEAFREAFLEVAAHHRKHEYKAKLTNNFAPGPRTLVMQEGGILWHLARRKGIAPAWGELPQEVQDHLMTIETVTRKA